ERVETILAARGGDDAVTAVDERSCDGGAEPCGRPGDEHDHCCSMVGEKEGHKPTSNAALRQGRFAHPDGAQAPWGGAVADTDRCRSRLPIQGRSHTLTRSIPA